MSEKNDNLNGSRRETIKLTPKDLNYLKALQQASKLSAPSEVDAEVDAQIADQAAQEAAMKKIYLEDTENTAASIISTLETNLENENIKLVTALAIIENDDSSDDAISEALKKLVEINKQIEKLTISLEQAKQNARDVEENKKSQQQIENLDGKTKRRLAKDIREDADSALSIFDIE